jgi:Fur family ferric uptake transcriptional regulator
VTEGWETRLREQGFRITPQRQLVLEAVETLRHGTPEEILIEVQRTATGVNLSTVYRTLEVLEEVGLVTHAHIGHGAPTYHAVDDHVHIHLVCDRCGKVMSVSAEVADDFVDRLRTDHEFVTDISHMAIHGWCTACIDRSREILGDDEL